MLEAEEAASSGALPPACFPLGSASFESKNFFSLDIFESMALLWLAEFEWASSVGAFSEARLLRDDFFSIRSCFCSPGFSWPCSTSQSSEKKSLFSSLLFAAAALPVLVLVCWCALSFFSM